MRKIVISIQHRVRAENAAKPHRVKPYGKHRQRGFSKELKCSKCGATLKLGDTAFRSARHYLCEDCGKKAEI